MRENRKKPALLLFLFAALCLLLPASFITYHVLNPSDGARLSTGEAMFTPLGAIMSPYYSGSSELREGDVVVEVAGRSMEAWAEDLFQYNSSLPDPQFGESINYGVMRDGKRIDVDVILGRLPVKSILARHWGALLFAFASQVVALFVLVRRPGDPAARALFIWAMSGSHTYAWSFFMQVGDVVGGFGFWLFRMSTPGLWLLYWPAALHLALVFPRPLPLIKRFRWLIPGIYFLSYLIFIGSIVAAIPGSENILVWLDFWGPAETLVAAIFLLATVFTIVLQYRTSRTWNERARIRLVVWSGAVTGIIGLVLWIIIPTVSGVSLLNPNLLGVLMLLFPLSMAVAIWRHHLFDIDVIIRRTLVYGVLTISLLAIYFGSVILLQSIFAAVSGQSSPVAIVISTLVIAALFNPLRINVQEFIDRRFFRSKYDAQQAVERFTIIARDETDLKTLNEELIRVAKNTMQPDSLSLWLRNPGE